MNKYYSQCGQDKFLNEKLFKQKQNGVFLDIGANDGVTLSNTYFFEKELGWKGICFEPLSEAFSKLQQSRSSLNINACASNEDKIDYFLSITGYGEMLSGLKSNYDDRHLQRIEDTIKEYGGSKREIEVQCFDINKILKKHNYTEIDFISIDTEGNELEILKAIDFTQIHVKAITVENNYKDAKMALFLATQNFVKIKVLDADEVYVNKKYFGFLSRMLIKL
jgi:FkbM family methyltransferase